MDEFTTEEIMILRKNACDPRFKKLMEDVNWNSHANPPICLGAALDLKHILGIYGYGLIGDALWGIVEEEERRGNTTPQSDRAENLLRKFWGLHE